MGSSLRVAIAGAGTAGPAAALFLARQGHQVALFERAPSPSPVGAGITLQPTGLSVLRQLGLLEEILAAGSRIDWLDGRTKSGRVVLDLKYRSLHPGFFGLGIHRGSLFHSLYTRLGQAGVSVRTGCPVDGFKDRGDAVEVATSEGPQSFDLLVVADGARSHLRSHHSSPAIVRKYEWGALWTVLPAPPPTDFDQVLAQVFDGTKRFVGFLPTGISPPVAGEERRRIVSLFWSIPASDMNDFRARGAEAFRRDVAELVRDARPEPHFREYVDAVLSGLDDSDQLLPATYYDVVMQRPASGRVVFLGDAAHAMSPQLGQGANLALYDAWVLSETLAEHGAAVPMALMEYVSRRRSHLNFYQWATRLLTPFFQSDWASLGLLRDLSMGPLCRLPFFSRQGLGSMAGFKTGVFGEVPVSRRLRSAAAGVSIDSPPLR